ncbi:MAG: TIGR03619 family F420-dependent LLM class oxidoreductase [Candidatus Dormiibacterota bacterium]
MRLGTFFAPWGPAASLSGAEQAVHQAESSGFATLWTGDHLLFPEVQLSRYPYNSQAQSPFAAHTPLLEAVTLLAYLAGVSATIGLGISVLVLPLRNPILTAKQLANVQTLSQGRLIVGLGIGWLREEFEALGVPFRHRGDITDDYIAALQHLWHGAGAPFQGRHVAIEAAGFAPKPEPIPPLVIGGNSERALRRAARLGDGWHPLRLGPLETRAGIEKLAQFAELEHRDPTSLRVVLRTSLLEAGVLQAGPPGAGDRLLSSIFGTLEEYRSAGVTEFVIEFPYPDCPPERQIEWLQWLGEQRVTRQFNSEAV